MSLRPTHNQGEEEEEEAAGSAAQQGGGEEGDDAAAADARSTPSIGPQRTSQYRGVTRHRRSGR